MKGNTMGWTDFTDEKQPVASSVRTCFRCLQKIPAGGEFFHRVGLLDGVKKTCVYHEDCLPGEADPATDEAAWDAADASGGPLGAEEDSVTTPPETTPLATTADEEAAAASEAAAAEAAAVAAGELSPSQRQRLEHLAVIKAKGDEADVAYANWCDAAATAKELKKVYEGRMGELRSIIRNGNAQTRLPFAAADEDDETPVKPATAAEQPEWMGRPLSVLNLPESLVEKLAEGAIETLGHLKAFWDAGRVLNDLKGIGSEKAARVADAWASYAAEHPEVFNADGDPATGDDAEGDDVLGDDAPADDAAEDDDDPFSDDPPYSSEGEGGAAA